MFRSRGNVFPRSRVCVSPSPFQRGHPATPRCRLRRNSSSASGRNRHSGASVPLRDRRALRWRRLRSPRLRHLRRFVARARPFGGIAFLRRLRTRHRRLTALQPAPTPPALPFGLSAPRRVLRAGPAHSSLVLTAQSPLGLGCSLSLHRSRPSVVSKATPRGLPDCSTCAGWQSSARAPPPVRTSRYCSLRCAPPCADGAGRRHPSGAADFRFGSGGVRVARPAAPCALVGALFSNPHHEYVISRFTRPHLQSAFLRRSASLRAFDLCGACPARRFLPLHVRFHAAGRCPARG